MVALDAPGVTDMGEKLQVVPDGKPEQEKATCCPKPFSGDMVMIVDPDCPGVTANDDGEIERVKSGGGGALMTKDAETIELALLPGIIAIALMVSLPVTWMGSYTGSPRAGLVAIRFHNRCWPLGRCL